MQHKLLRLKKNEILRNMCAETNFLNDQLIQPIFISHFQDKNLDVKKFYLAHSYERVMPGDQYYDSIVNFWRVYSGINEHSKRKCEEFLSQIIKRELLVQFSYLGFPTICRAFPSRA